MNIVKTFIKGTYFIPACLLVVIFLLLYIVITVSEIKKEMTKDSSRFLQFGSLSYPEIIGNIQSQIIDIDRKIDKQQQLIEYIHEDTRDY